MTHGAIEPTVQVAEVLGVQFLELLGQGAHGTVYKARRLSDNQVSAVRESAKHVLQLTHSFPQLVAVKAMYTLAIGPEGPQQVEDEM